MKAKIGLIFIATLLIGCGGAQSPSTSNENDSSPKTVGLTAIFPETTPYCDLYTMDQAEEMALEMERVWEDLRADYILENHGSDCDLYQVNCPEDGLDVGTLWPEAKYYCHCVRGIGTGKQDNRMMFECSGIERFYLDEAHLLSAAEQDDFAMEQFETWKNQGNGIYTPIKWEVSDE